jgi:hypothetical protein
VDGQAGRTETVQYTPKIMHGLFFVFLNHAHTSWWVGIGGRIGDGDGRDDRDGETLVFPFTRRILVGQVHCFD